MIEHAIIKLTFTDESMTPSSTFLDTVLAAVMNACTTTLCAVYSEDNCIGIESH
jgi:hypothetical protein